MQLWVCEFSTDMLQGASFCSFNYVNEFILKLCAIHVTSCTFKSIVLILICYICLAVVKSVLWAEGEEMLRMFVLGLKWAQRDISAPFYWAQMVCCSCWYLLNSLYTRNAAVICSKCLLSWQRIKKTLELVTSGS